MILSTCIKSVAAAVIIVVIFCGCSTAVPENEWDAITCILSYSNPSIHINNYTIELVDFDGYGSAHLTLSGDGIIIDSMVPGNCDTGWSTADNGRVEIKGIRVTDRRKISIFGRWPDDPKAEFAFRIKREETPCSIVLEIDLDKDEYLLDEIVTAKITVKNVGETDASNIPLNVGADGLYTDDKLAYGYDNIKDGSSRSETFKFRFNHTLSDNMSVFASVTRDDEKQNITVSEAVDIEPPVKIIKSMTGNGNTNSIYFTTISITNTQSREIHIVLADVLPMGFSLINGSVTDGEHDLIWEFDINPDETRSFSYQSVTDRIAVYRVPTPYAKCTLSGRVFIISPDYSTFITVNRIQPDNEYRHDNKETSTPSSTPTPTPTPTPTLTPTPTETEPPEGPDVNLIVTVLPAVSLEVTPTSLDFGTLAPGTISSRKTLTLNNSGGSDIIVTTNVKDSANNLFIDGIMLNNEGWDKFNLLLMKKNKSDVSTELSVSGTYTLIGNKEGSLVFWARSANY